MKNPKPYIRLLPSGGWKAILVGEAEEKNSGARYLTVSGQPRDGYDTAKEASEFIKNKWTREQDMRAYASRHGNGTWLSPDEEVKEVRFSADHPLSFYNRNGKAKKPSKKESKPEKATKAAKAAKAEYAVPERVPMKDYAVQFLVASSGNNGDAINRAQARMILSALSKTLQEQFNVSPADLERALSIDYIRKAVPDKAVKQMTAEQLSSVINVASRLARGELSLPNAVH